MERHTEILNRHSKEMTGNDFKMLLRLTPNKTHTEIIIDIVTRAMEEVENSKTPKINLKELREKYRQEWNAKGEINFFNGWLPLWLFSIGL